MFKSISRTIRVLVVSDFFLNCGWGLIGPIFAIFIMQNIATESTAEAVRVAGFASLFYWIAKSILQVPIGHYLDKNHGNKDDFLFLVLGTFLAGLVPFGYLISSTPWHIYACQLLYAVSMAMAFPPFLAIFTKYIDKGREAFEWSLESTSIGLGAGIAGAVGGILASIFGFELIFIAVGGLTIFSAFLLLLIRKDMVKEDHLIHKIFPSKPF